LSHPMGSWREMAAERPVVGCGTSALHGRVTVDAFGSSPCNDPKAAKPLLGYGSVLVRANLNQLLILEMARSGGIHVVRVARPATVIGANGLARLGRKPVDLLGAQHPTLLEDGTLLGRQSRGLLNPVPLEAFGLATGKLPNLLGDPHGAPVVAAHGAKVRVDVQILVVEGASRVRIEGQLEVLFPVQR